MSELREAMDRAHKSLCRTSGTISIIIGKKRATHEDLTWMHERLGDMVANFGVIEHDLREAYRLFSDVMAARPKPEPKPAAPVPQTEFNFDAEMPETVARQAKPKRRKS